jgi:hypothetical protein
MILDFEQQRSGPDAVDEQRLSERRQSARRKLDVNH